MFFVVLTIYSFLPRWSDRTSKPSIPVYGSNISFLATSQWEHSSEQSARTEFGLIHNMNGKKTFSSDDSHGDVE